MLVSRTLQRAQLVWPHLSGCMGYLEGCGGQQRRGLGSERVGALWRSYSEAKEMVDQKQLPAKVNPKGVFANNDLDLGRIGVYGFDYDYTLAVYTRDLNSLIYSLALHGLINTYKYPSGIQDIFYDPNFAVRGLHYDIKRGILMKLDAFAQIQSGTVYKGMQRMTDENVGKIYPGLRIPNRELDDGSDCNLKQLSDLFSLPEIGVLATVVEYFEQKNINYDAFALFNDVQAAVKDVHVSGDMYETIGRNMNQYIHKNPGLRQFIDRLYSNGKIVFLITNSPFDFMDKGMKYLIGDDWRNFFHYIVVKAQKPRFFDSMKPFRELLPEQGIESWERVGDLNKGRIYSGGNLEEFVRKTGIYPKDVLYFGDHIYTDLKDPTLKLGWATGAIVPELGREISVRNTPEYQKDLMWLEMLTSLVESKQNDKRHPELESVVDMWLAERNQLRSNLKTALHPHFGSIFRTWHTPTYFSQRLMRLADIYTSRLPNLLQYNLDHTFYPRRSPLPHESLVQMQYPSQI